MMRRRDKIPGGRRPDPTAWAPCPDHWRAGGGTLIPRSPLGRSWNGREVGLTQLSDLWGGGAGPSGPLEAWILDRRHPCGWQWAACSSGRRVACLANNTIPPTALHRPCRREAFANKPDTTATRPTGPGTVRYLILVYPVSIRLDHRQLPVLAARRPVLDNVGQQGIPVGGRVRPSVLPLPAPDDVLS